MKHQKRGSNRTRERELRRRLTDAENLAWAILRSRGLQRWKFRRQHRIENIILDFYCPRLRVNVEFDGDPHFTQEGRLTDAARDVSLRALGIRVLRIENRELAANPPICASAILQLCESQAQNLGYIKPPKPSPRTHTIQQSPIPAGRGETLAELHSATGADVVSVLDEKPDPTEHCTSENE